MCALKIFGRGLEVPRVCLKGHWGRFGGAKGVPLKSLGEVWGCQGVP